MPNTRPKPVPLTGQARETVIGYVHKPLVAWLNTMMVKIFDVPKSSDACDATAEAVARALRDTIGQQPCGTAVLKRLALDLLDSIDKQG